MDLSRNYEQILDYQITTVVFSSSSKYFPEIASENVFGFDGQNYDCKETQERLRSKRVEMSGTHKFM